MATRSMIARVREDGTVQAVYCHWDGYPQNNGAILHQHYSDAEKVQQLLDLGNLSNLGPNIDRINEDDCTFYLRDMGRNPADDQYRFFDNIEEAVAYYDGSWCEWFYKFEDGIWWAMGSNMSDWRSLVGVLEDVEALA